MEHKILTLLLLVCSAAYSAQTKPLQACDRYAFMAEMFARARDSGMPESEAAERIDKIAPDMHARKVAMNALQVVYAYPEVKPEEMAELAKTSCLKGS